MTASMFILLEDSVQGCVLLQNPSGFVWVLFRVDWLTGWIRGPSFFPSAHLCFVCASCISYVVFLISKFYTRGLCLQQISNSAFRVMWFDWDNAGKPEWSFNFIINNLITSSKSLFLNKSTYSLIPVLGHECLGKHAVFHLHNKIPARR